MACPSGKLPTTSTRPADHTVPHVRTCSAYNSSLDFTNFSPENGIKIVMICPDIQRSHLISTDYALSNIQCTVYWYRGSLLLYTGILLLYGHSRRGRGGGGGTELDAHHSPFMFIFISKGHLLHIFQVTDAFDKDIP